MNEPTPIYNCLMVTAKWTPDELSPPFDLHKLLLEHRSEILAETGSGE